MAVATEAPWLALEGYALSVIGLDPLAGGHINAAWRVTTSEGRHFFLQRLNPVVFPDGAAVMRNLERVTAHLGREVEALPDGRRRALRLQARRDGTIAWQDAEGAWWRLLHFIEGTRTPAGPVSVRDAREVGRAFGLFQRLLSDYQGPALEETIPGFHDTAARLARLDATVDADIAARAASVRRELEFARARRDYVEVLPPLIASGALPRRIVHNDAKAGNVLLDAESGEALAVVDLDTVMPGTLLYDLGDLIRSTASPTDEDERDLGRITVRLPVISALAAGFLGACGRSLTEGERTYFVVAGLLLTYEQGVRFLSDHLAGDRYYRIVRPGQNLDRARAQFRLLERLESSRGELEAMVARTLRESPE